jgi:hypothetical protein
VPTEQGLEQVAEESEGFSFAQVRESFVMAGQRAFKSGLNVTAADLLWAVRSLRKTLLFGSLNAKSAGVRFWRSQLGRTFWRSKDRDISHQLFPVKSMMFSCCHLPETSIRLSINPSMAKYYEAEWFNESLRFNDDTGMRLADDEDHESFDHVFDGAPVCSPTATMQHSDAEWHPRSRIIEVNRYQIEGMVYVGTCLPAVKGQGTEPALINPRLRMQTPFHSYQAQDLPYWPSYGELSPQARGKFLQWLAGGRKDPAIAIGYVFLFFYGLERRLLADGRCSDEEQTELVSEIERLRGIYGRNAAFHNYSYRLLDFLRAKELDKFVLEIEHCAPPPVQQCWEQPYSSALRMGLGQCAAYGMEVPAPWALAWAKSHPGYRSRTAAERCAQEFEDLFGAQFSQAFPYGLNLRSGKQKIRIDYRPASASFGRPLTVQSTLPEVTLFHEPGASLKTMALDCLEQLDAYSRHLGRNPEARESVAALALLPEPLLERYADRIMPDLCCWLATILEGGFVAVTGRALLQKVGMSSEALPKKDAVLLARFLERLKVGMEPDPRFGAAIPDLDGLVVLFRADKELPSDASTGYSVAVTALTLAVSCNRAVMERDECVECEFFKTIDLTAAEKLRLQARRLWLLQTPISLSSLRMPTHQLTVETREQIGNILLAMTRAAGQIGPSEIDALTSVYRQLRLDPKRVFSAAHAHTTESFSVRRAQTAPPRDGISNPLQRTVSSDQRLDMEKVNALALESEHVSVLLNEIFVDDQAGGSAVAIKQELPGLDGPHSHLLATILTRESWGRADLACIAADCQILLEGAIDSLNELALDRYGDPLLEGDDPVYLNSMVAKELQNDYD